MDRISMPSNLPDSTLFQDQLPALYDLKSRADGLKDEEMEGYHASRREVEATLEDIKAEFTNLNARHSEGWTDLTAKAVGTNYLHLMSPEEMMQSKCFLDNYWVGPGMKRPTEKM
ncbi:hypothetical protein BASA50_006683 [Batrachochytrium salamandrivorans]|uniref:Uncharacterized protein n=1 Tax=Batrachochytrium salamandrivorans TaxID=1357716 RepID=A0ABQ8F9C8_9FUNG|nr:hypothetical protein BASA50_006683 [Batrachochytrium salamandrivorans]